MSINYRRVSRRSMLASAGAIALSPLVMKSAAAQDIQTRVQFLHGSGDIGSVEVHLNGEEELDGFEYGDTSDWIDLDPGAVRVTITYDRAGFNYVAYDNVVPVPAGNDYYCVISDLLLIPGTFDRSEIPGGDGARLQITHASVDTPAINVIANMNSLELAAELRYAVTSESVVTAAGSYTLDFTLTDTGENVLSVPEVIIESGKSYALILIGEPGDEDKPLEVAVLETSLTVTGSTATPAS